MMRLFSFIFLYSYVHTFPSLLMEEKEMFGIVDKLFYLTVSIHWICISIVMKEWSTESNGGSVVAGSRDDKKKHATRALNSYIPKPTMRRDVERLVSVYIYCTALEYQSIYFPKQAKEEE